MRSAGSTSAWSVAVFQALCVSTSAWASQDGRLHNTGYHANPGVLQYVNPLVGTKGSEPNNNGGMIPSVAPPFAMTRWTPQTRENYISQVPYSDYDGRVHGFQATHQPAIWMGEQGHVVLSPGTGRVKPLFQDRGLSFRKEDEKSTPYVYEVVLDADSQGEFGWELTEEAASQFLGSGCPPCPGGEAPVPHDVAKGTNGRVKRAVEAMEYAELQAPLAPPVASQRNLTSDLAAGEYSNAITVAMAATSHVGYLRCDFSTANEGPFLDDHRYISIQATRLNWTGHVEIDVENREISGSNSQRQDYALGPDRAESFRGYFVSRFSDPFATFGVTHGSDVQKGHTLGEGKNLGAFATFDTSVSRVEVRTAVSFVSVEQARRNLDIEVPDGTSFEAIVERTKEAWLDRLGKVTIRGINDTDHDHDPRRIFYTGLFHALQYPNDFSEPTETEGGPRRFYSGYTDSVHEAEDSYYQSWSLWDTYRAEHSLLTLFVPDRVDSMMRSLLRIFDWSGRLPLWANMIETNIMVATNADAALANALSRGFQGFDVVKAWAAVRKDCYEPPERDTELLYYDREPFTPHEARAGLTSYMDHGWVDNDRWAESASRTLDYAFNDYAAAIVATYAGDEEAAEALFARSRNFAHLWNPETEFMQARNANGSWADPSWGWTEGDQWVYTFDVMHDVGGLASLFKDGTTGMKAKLDEHFAGDHNLHSNEPSHHVPYLYSALGYISDASDKIREIAWDQYNATANGLSGNEDLGQMSAWYVFSSMGFYPLNPAGDEYIVGTPLFDEIRIDGPGGRDHTLTISAPGAASGSRPYVIGLTVDGETVETPVLKHRDITGARRIEFTMSDSPSKWGSQGIL